MDEQRAWAINSQWADVCDRVEGAQAAMRAMQETLGRGKGGREAALVQTKLDEARLWLREVWDIACDEIPANDGGE